MPSLLIFKYLLKKRKKIKRKKERKIKCDIVFHCFLHQVCSKQPTLNERQLAKVWKKLTDVLLSMPLLQLFIDSCLHFHTEFQNVFNVNRNVPVMLLYTAYTIQLLPFEIFMFSSQKFQTFLSSSGWVWVFYLMLKMSITAMEIITMKIIFCPNLPLDTITP